MTPSRLGCPTPLLVTVIVHVLAVMLGVASGAPTQDTPASALPGPGLAGWRADVPGSWSVRDGALVAEPGGSGWIRSERAWRDLECHLRFQLPPGAVGAFALRSPGAADPVRGAPHLELQPDAAGADQWISVRAVGPTLLASLPGADSAAPVVAPADPQPTGFLAIRHAPGLVVTRLDIRDLSPDPDTGGWTPLFNGRDLEGWTARGIGRWTVEDGTVVGRDGPGHLFSHAAFADAEIRALVRVSTRGNGGLYVRAAPDPRQPESWPLGYEAQVDNHDPRNFTGAIYDRAPAARQVATDGRWFDYRVRVDGARMQTWVNGVPMADAELRGRDDGVLALQTHHPGNEIRWRDLRVRPLDRARTVRVFYCTHSADFRHEVLPESRAVMERLGNDLDWLEVTVTDNIADLTPDRLASTDVVMLFTTGELPMGPMRERLLEWVGEGHGFVGVHSATDTFHAWPPFIRFLGGEFDGHPWNEEVRIVVDDPAHPGMAPLVDGGTGAFRIADEIYQFRNLAPDARVLMRLDPATARTEPGRPYPLAWTRAHGAGRVFYTALGHRPEVWRDARFTGSLLGAIRWASGASADGEARP